MKPATCVLSLALATAQGQTLRSYDIDPAGISVSGVSSGGYMAHQFHIAHSADVRGAAIFAGGPYYCADGGYPFNFNTAADVCMDLEDWIPFSGPPAVGPSLLAIQTEAAWGRIDNPLNLRDDRVYLFSGTRDETVPQPVMDVLDSVYRSLVSAEGIVYVDDVAAGHAMITDDPADTACDLTEPPYLNDCDLDAAGALLRHIYGDLNAAQPARAESLLAFGQAEFADGDPQAVSLAETGYVYVPQSCRDGARCRLHIAFHGCRQYAGAIGDAFYAGAGYNGWAEANAIIVLYPQTTTDTSWGLPWPNPRGCWDWWGYTGSDYHVRSGAQIAAVWAMVARLTGR